MERPVWFCRWCWREISEIAARCPACGHDVGHRLTYREELELALTCPESQTARRAAWLLGELRDPAAVPALVETVQRGDPYVAGEAVQALARIATDDALAAIAQAAAHRYATVRAAVQAVARTGLISDE